MRKGENLFTEVLSLRGRYQTTHGDVRGRHDSFFYSSFGIISHSSLTNSNAFSCTCVGLYLLVSDAVSSKF